MDRGQRDELSSFYIKLYLKSFFTTFFGRIFCFLYWLLKEKKPQFHTLIKGLLCCKAINFDLKLPESMLQIAILLETHMSDKNMLAFLNKISVKKMSLKCLTESNWKKIRFAIKSYNWLGRKKVVQFFFGLQEPSGSFASLFAPFWGNDVSHENNFNNIYKDYDSF